MKRFAYARAADLDEAARLMAAGARPVAGGTDLLTVLKADLAEPAALVDIRRLPGLAGVTPLPDGGLRIGALTTLAELAEHPEVRRAYPALAQAALSAATPQLRNMGTLGGNLLQQPRCWYYRNGFTECVFLGGQRCPCTDGENAFHAIFAHDRCAAVHPSDPAVALLAYGARVRTWSPPGERILAVDELAAPPEPGRGQLHTLAADELLLAVELPAPPPGLRSAYRKAMNRAVWAFALASVAVALLPEADDPRRVRDARVVLGGVAYRPWRSQAAEAVLRGRRLDPATVDAAADAALDGARPLAHNGYKLDLVRGLVREVLHQLGEPA